jgi:uncharacterized membrane protein YcaP (DUF421 family)
MWDLAVNPLELVARTAIMYALFLAALRLAGKREIGQFTLFDLAMVLLVANALQPAMTGADQSVTGGAIILATIFVLNRLVAVARVRIPFVRRILEFKPTTIGQDGKWLKAEFARQGIDLGDAEAALRQHGLERVDQMKRATLEEDGSISIVAAPDPTPGGAPGAAQRRFRRYRKSRM